ncbi:hypothetical protein [Kitasatospora sp. NPDC056531]|uniref:hypothetical protein n=1 Tax=Kitasatospora sp. NPDC056531 TaxID=3345856 RepID=UPI0036C84B28
MVAIVTAWQLRMLRAAVFAALCVAVSATAHFSMSEAELPGPTLVAAFAGTAGGTWLLAGRRRGLAVIGLWMVAAQSALHLLFESTSSTGGAAVKAGSAAPDWASLLLCSPGGDSTGIAPAGLARMAGLDSDALPVAGMPGMAGIRSMPGADSMAMAHGLSGGMLAAHLMAALVCALLLRRGEAAIVGIFEVLRTLAGVFLPVLLLLAPGGHKPAEPARPRPRRDRLPRLEVLSHALVRRGPPSVAPAV